MNRTQLWRQISAAIACGAISACDSGSSEPASVVGTTITNPTAVDQPIQPQSSNTPPTIGGAPAELLTAGNTSGLQTSRMGSATVRWTPPSTNTDGSPLADLRGYRISYGSSPTNLSQEVDIPNAAVSSAIIDELASGQWYFAVRAYNSGGIQSALSNVASKTIQ